MLKNIMVAAGAVFLMSASAASAGPKAVQFKKPNETKSVGSLGGNDLVFATGFITKKGSSVSNTLTFKAKTASITVNAAWNVQDEFRLLDVNIDLIDKNGLIVASDSLQGVTGSIAVSVLTFSGLNLEQTYKLRLTGTSVGVGSYELAIDPD